MYNSQQAIQCFNLFSFFACCTFLLTNSIQSEPITEVVNQIIRTEVKNRTLDEIVELPQELSLGFIVTDNINTSGHYLNESYQLNQDKIWQIRIPRQCRMIIYFREFDLEITEGCVKDYFTVQTSKAQKNFRKYCTKSLRRVEIRNRRRVQMWFHSDKAVAKKGIYGTFCFSKWPASADDTPCNCNLVRSRRRQRSLENDATTKPRKWALKIHTTHCGYRQNM